MTRADGENFLISQSLLPVLALEVSVVAVVWVVVAIKVLVGVEEKSLVKLKWLELTSKIILKYSY